MSDSVVFPMETKYNMVKKFGTKKPSSGDKGQGGVSKISKICRGEVIYLWTVSKASSVE